MLFSFFRLYRRWAFAGLLLALTPTLLPPPLAAAEAVPPARAAGPVEIMAETGRYSLLDADKGAEAGWEFRFAPRRLRWLPRRIPDLSPMAGAMATARGSLYVYAGFGLDLTLGEGFFLRPSWAAGLFKQGEDLRLGGPIEFRSALELSRRLTDRSRLGLTFYHLSNAGFFSRNPGSESLVLTFVTRP